MAHLIALLLGLLATSAAAARSRRMLLSKYSSSTHTSSGNSRLDMVRTSTILYQVHVTSRGSLFTPHFMLTRSSPPFSPTVLLYISQR